MSFEKQIHLFQSHVRVTLREEMLLNRFSIENVNSWNLFIHKSHVETYVRMSFEKQIQYTNSPL